MRFVNKTPRKRFTEHQRREVFNASKIPGIDAARCCYCGKMIMWNEDWEVAHNWPVSRWPWWLPASWRDSNANLLPAHKACNRAAGAEPMGFWQSLSLKTKLRIILVAIAFSLAAVIAIALACPS